MFDSFEDLNTDAPAGKTLPTWQVKLVKLNHTIAAWRILGFLADKLTFDMNWNGTENTYLSSSVSTPKWKFRKVIKPFYFFHFTNYTIESSVLLRPSIACHFFPSRFFFKAHKSLLPVAIHVFTPGLIPLRNPWNLFTNAWSAVDRCRRCCALSRHGTETFWKITCGESRSGRVPAWWWCCAWLLRR